MRYPELLVKSPLILNYAERLRAAGSAALCFLNCVPGVRVTPGAPPKLPDDAGQQLPPGGLTGELVEPGSRVVMRRVHHPASEQLAEQLPRLDRLPVEKALPVRERRGQLALQLGGPLGQDHEPVELPELRLEILALAFPRAQRLQDRGQGLAPADGLGEVGDRPLDLAQLVLEPAPSLAGASASVSSIASSIARARTRCTMRGFNTSFRSVSRNARFASSIGTVRVFAQALAPRW